MKAVLPDVDETAGGQVYFIGQELQQLHSIVQTQMTATEKTNHFHWTVFIHADSCAFYFL